MSIIINKVNWTHLLDTFIWKPSGFCFLWSSTRAEDPKGDLHNSLIITKHFFEGKKYERYVQCWKRVACSTGDLRVWALSQRMIFLKEMVHPAPMCMVGPSSLVCTVVPLLPCLLLLAWHLLLALQGSGLASLGSSSEMDGMVSWLVSPAMA